MRAVVLTEERPRLECVEVADPSPARGDALVTVTGCGICGSDLHSAAVMGSGGSILGHEIAGTVAGLGADVDATRWPIGTPVAVRPFSGCGQCRWCAMGRADHCREFAFIGFGRPGGFAEQTTAPAAELYRLPTSLTADEQVLVEPLAVARRALRRGALSAGDSVVVLGAGPIGLAVTAWARALGVETLIASEPSPSRRALAECLGATVTVDPTADDLAEVVAEHTDGGGPAIVFECSGRRGMIQQAAGLAAIDGRVVVVGICLMADELFPYTSIEKELDLRFALYYGRDDFIETLAALDSDQLQADAMVTDAVDLAQLPERFAALLHATDDGKVLVRP